MHEAMNDMVKSIEIIVPQNQLVGIFGNCKDFFKGKSFLFNFSAHTAKIAYFSNKSVF